MIEKSKWEKIHFHFSDRIELIESISPDIDTKWSYYETDIIDNSSKLIYCNGDALKLDTIPAIGFIDRCTHWPCYEIILYEKDSARITISTPEDFSAFIGTIDNIGEAILYLESKTDLDYVFYNWDEKLKLSFVEYKQSRKYIYIKYSFCPLSDQYSSLDDSLNVEEDKQKDYFELRIERKSKKVKIKKIE